MLGHGVSSAGSYLALCCHYPVSKCRSASIVVTGTLSVNMKDEHMRTVHIDQCLLMCREWLCFFEVPNV